MGRIEHSAIECRKTKTKAITTANHSLENITRSQSEFEVKTSRLHEEQENESYQAAIGFSIECDWLGKSFIDQSNDEIKRSQSNPGLFSALNLKFF